MALKKRAPRKTKPVESEVTFEQPVATVEEKKLPPWKDLAPKQKELMRLCREKTGTKKFIGVFGTRFSGKTWGILNCAVDHMWRTKNASVLILSGTQGSASTSGIWTELTEKVVPSWMEHSLSPEGTPKENEARLQWALKGAPHATISKKLVCSTNNMHGGTSKLELDSLDNEKEVESKFKSRYYSMIVISECGEFKQMLTLTTMMMALRGVGYSQDDFLLLVDANPPDEGQSHFLYRFFFELRLSAEPNAEEAAIQKCLYVTEWGLGDNTYATEEEKNAIRGLYKNDPALYERYVLGKWNRAVKDALFADIFRPAIHVFSGPRDIEQRILLPSEGCTELITGFDAGLVNPVAYVLERIVVQQFYQDRKTGDQKSRNSVFFQYLDELSMVGKETSVAEFTLMMLEILDYWENEMQKPILWWHYADNSALNIKESIANRTAADEMFAQSNGRIRLIGVEKGAGSVALRIQLLRRLLAEDRILISGMKCPNLIEMFQGLRKGRVDGSVATHAILKHYFDASSYPLVRLCFDEIQTMIRGVHARSKPAGGSLVNLQL